jgi:predicted nucleotidyltransferase
MKELNLVIQLILDCYPETQAMYLFGSYATEYERQDSDVDIAVLLTPPESKRVGSLMGSELHFALEEMLHREVDLINLRQVPTVLQKEVIASERRIFERGSYAAQEFEMLTLSQYQKLNEERAEIVEEALAGGRFHQV